MMGLHFSPYPNKGQTFVSVCGGSIVVRIHSSSQMFAKRSPDIWLTSGSTLLVDRKKTLTPLTNMSTLSLTTLSLNLPFPYPLSTCCWFILKKGGEIDKKRCITFIKYNERSVQWKISTSLGWNDKVSKGHVNYHTALHITDLRQHSRMFNSQEKNISITVKSLALFRLPLWWSMHEPSTKEVLCF